MRYKQMSAYAAGVLSIFLIFTLFSSFGIVFGFDYAEDMLQYEENQENSCAMNAPLCDVPFGNTVIMSSHLFDVSEENRLWNIPSVLSDCRRNITVNGSSPIKSSAESDRQAEFSVRLLI